MSGGRFGSASGIRRTINATLSPFKSFRQITPSHRRHIPVRRERRIKGAVFCAHPVGRSPQANAGFRKLDERGASVAKQKFKLSGSSVWTSGRGLAVRFGPASWASLVIEFCQQGGFYRLAEKFVSCCMFLPDGEGLLFVEEVPLSHYVFKCCICRGPSVLSKTRKQRSAFFENLSARVCG